ncbi:MAG TPA: amino acid permease [Thermoleophilia bacterium]|nr:amino acid permease [Thermoleophilia bacterium]
MTDPRPAPISRDLPRTLTLVDLALLSVGSVIGSGIFLLPATVLRQCGGEPGLALAVWIVGGVLCVLGALTYGELGAMQPEAGGLYVFVRDAFGRLPAFLYGWTLFLVIGSGAVATLAVAFATYLQEFVVLGPVAQKLVAVAMIAVLAAINVVGTRRSADVQNWTTATKVGAILAMGLVLLARGGRLGELDFVPRRLDLGGFGIAMVAVLWAYEGWQFVTFSAGETRDPQRTFPLGIISGTAAVGVLYLLANLGYWAALGPVRAVQSERIASEAVGGLLGPGMARGVAAVILVSMFSAANSIMLTSPRVYFAMARDRVFFRRLAEVHPSFETPAFAVVTGAGWAALLAASGTFEQLLTYVVFAGWIFYGLGAAAIFSYRRRRPDAARPFRVPGYPWTPLLFVASAVGIVANTLVSQPGRAAVGLSIVALGVPVYWMWRRAG